MNRKRVTRVAALMALALICATVAPVFAAGSEGTTPDLLKQGNQWVSVRAGYAKVAGRVAPNGNLGYGFGYSRFVLDKWSVGGYVHHEQLGRSGKAVDIQVPISLEVVRHSRWGTALFPYAGLGVGAFYNKRYRTGEDWSGFQPGRYVAFGARTPIRAKGLLGVDLRMVMADKPDENPAFAGPSSARYHVDDLLKDLQEDWAKSSLMLFDDTESKTRVLWSVKIDYTFTY